MYDTGLQFSYRHDRKGKTGGGDVAYVSNNISYTHRVDLQTEETESIWLQVHLKNSKDILLGITYRPPNSLATWYEKIEAELENASREATDLVLMGEFYINLNLASSNVRWNTIIETKSLVQLVKETTRLTEATSSLLDHIYVSRPDYAHGVQVHKLGLSDHYPITLTLNKKKNRNNKGHSMIKYKCRNNFEPLKFRNALSKLR